MDITKHLIHLKTIIKRKDKPITCFSIMIVPISFHIIFAALIVYFITR